MFASNPFAEISASIAPAVMRALPILQEAGGASLRGKLKQSAQCSSRMPPEGPTGYAVREVLTSCHTSTAPRLKLPLGIRLRSS